VDYTEYRRLTFSAGGTVIATGMMGGGTAIVGMRSGWQGFETEAVHSAHYHELKEPLEPMPLYESGPLVAGAGAALVAYKAGQAIQHAWDRFTFHR
jgi:hypothetical protein